MFSFPLVQIRFIHARIQIWGRPALGGPLTDLTYLCCMLDLLYVCLTYLKFLGNAFHHPLAIRIVRFQNPSPTVRFISFPTPKDLRGLFV